MGFGTKFTFEKDGQKFFLVMASQHHEGKFLEEHGWQPCVVTNASWPYKFYSRTPNPYPESMFKPLWWGYSVHPYWGRSSF